MFANFWEWLTGLAWWQWVILIYGCGVALTFVKFSDAKRLMLSTPMTDVPEEDAGKWWRARSELRMIPPAGYVFLSVVLAIVWPFTLVAVWLDRSR